MAEARRNRIQKVETEIRKRKNTSLSELYLWSSRELGISKHILKEYLDILKDVELIELNSDTIKWKGGKEK